MNIVVKRDGSKQSFNKVKIYEAIMKAMKNGSGIIESEIAAQIANEIEALHTSDEAVAISTIELEVFNKLIEHNQILTARAYEGYRKVREFQRNNTALDDTITTMIDGSNREVIDENSNKNGYIAGTQRDLIAGEYSRDYSRRNLLPADITQAHDEGVIHFHDLDYFIQHIHNCQLIDLENMLQNGTVINKKMIEQPKSFQTACTVATQICQQVACGQYGGQTISVAHLAPFVRVSEEKWRKKLTDELSDYVDEDKIEELVQKRLHEEIVSGVQTIQYQVNTFATSNGQAPFLSIFMYINEKPEYKKETAMIIEEILNQRVQGMKNEVGVFITPAFPKLLYVLDENNTYPETEYWYLTWLAVQCLAKRMMPDMMSGKIMKENYGDIFPCMGCRSFLSPWRDENGNLKWYGRFNQGVVTLNLVDVALSSNKDQELFWKILDERAELCHRALMLKHERLEGTTSDISPIHWQNGSIARLEKGEVIDKYLHDGYSTLSLGYAGLYECVYYMLGESHTDPDGEEFALKVMNRLRKYCDDWKAESGLGFSLYGSPIESTTYKFAKCLKRRFGVIPGVTDKDYITNSYHVNVQEEIDAFRKLGFEAQFQKISSGGCISYAEVTNLTNNLDALVKLVQYMYETIQYAEINTKSDYCQVCGFDGEILIDDDGEWYCPQCGNRDHDKMNVCRRTCGLTR